MLSIIPQTMTDTWTWNLCFYQKLCINLLKLFPEYIFLETWNTGSNTSWINSTRQHLPRPFRIGWNSSKCAFLELLYKYCEQLSKSVDGHMLFDVSWALVNDTVIKLRVHCIAALRNRKTLRTSRAPNCWHASVCRNFARLSWIDALLCSRFVYRSSYATLLTELLFIHDNFQLSKAMRRPK